MTGYHGYWPVAARQIDARFGTEAELELGAPLRGDVLALCEEVQRLVSLVAHHGECGAEERRAAARVLQGHHVGALVDEGADALAISTAHGHTKGVGDALRLLRKSHKHITLIAGNVTSGEGVEFLAAAGADTVKIGQGPGSICTTRIVAGVGIPQLTALYVASRAAAKKGVRILADGGITKSGDIVKALTLADAVILGGLLAGSREAPGKLMEINGKTYKEYRGMGSHEAMRKGFAARYGHSASGKFSKVAAEGIEALKEVSGTVDQVLGTLAGGVQSGLGYLGARNLTEHRANARYIRVTPAGQREAAPHDVIEIKEIGRASCRERVSSPV